MPGDDRDHIPPAPHESRSLLLLWGLSTNHCFVVCQVTLRPCLTAPCDLVLPLIMSRTSCFCFHSVTVTLGSYVRFVELQFMRFLFWCDSIYMCCVLLVWSAAPWRAFCLSISPKWFAVPWFG